MTSWKFGQVDSRIKDIKYQLKCKISPEDLNSCNRINRIKEFKRIKITNLSKIHNLKSQSCEDCTSAPYNIRFHGHYNT